MLLVLPLQVCMATDNLFQRCRQRSHTGHSNTTNPLGQLDVIGNFVSDLLALKDQRAPQKALTSPPSVHSVAARTDKAVVPAMP